MKVTSTWIKECLRRTMLSDRQVVEALERAGMEIEQFITSTEIDKRVVTALVKKVVQHPGADRLKLVEVETNEGKYGVVCGAPNVREGMRVAFAQVGAVLPDGERIAKAKLRGEYSEGMLCSEQELGLGQNHDGLLELPPTAGLGEPVSSLYPAESVIDLKTPANRWDVQSVYGLAREVAAMTDSTLLPLTPPLVEFADASGVLAAKPEAARYMVAKVRVRQTAGSPLSVAARLRAAGVRSIGPVVDVTNYVLLETGQPLHAFDAAKVKLPIVVRRARAGEELVTLDGVRRTLSEADLVIADGSGPIALAGLMGGQSTEVSGETEEILLEAAVFDGATVRKMAQRHGLRTEASARFERALPVVLPPLGLARAVELLGEVAEGQLVHTYEAPYAHPSTWNIALAVPKLVRTVGFGITHKEAVAALARLGIEAKVKGEVIEVAEVPWWRPDLREPADLVEEIVRVMGYERVPSTIPSWRPRRIEFDRQRTWRRRIRDTLWAAGGFEVMTYSFVSAHQLERLGLDLGEHLKLKNPLSSEQAYLRSSLLPSHLTTLERNRMYAKAVTFYEISKVFLKRSAGDQPDEPERLAVTVLDPERAYAVAKGLLDALGDALNVDVVVRPAQHAAYVNGRFGEVLVGDKVVGGIGQLLPSHLRALKLDGEVAHLELDLGPLVAASGTRAYVAPGVFPATTRDIALVVPREVSWQAVREAAAGWELTFVGDYYGEGLPPGHKGMTIRVRLALPDRTPTESDATQLEEAVLARLRHKVGAQRRG
ncbi:MAG TPA: phenylalanine--tRNA ligase subunit beta [Candidatus Saccharimonadia bacterium]|nr:phenylalanine--tRNA ligase subunit beta [Candidatus Saccharimonadia bacterium]